MASSYGVAGQDILSQLVGVLSHGVHIAVLVLSQLASAVTAGLLTVVIVQLLLLLGVEVTRAFGMRRSVQRGSARQRGSWARQVWGRREDLLLIVFALLAPAGTIYQLSPAVGVLWTGWNEAFFAVGLVAYLSYAVWRLRNLVPPTNARIRRLLRLPLGIPYWTWDAWFFTALASIWLLYPSLVGLVLGMATAQAWRVMRPQGWHERPSSFIPAVGVLTMGLVVANVAGLFHWVDRPSTELLTQAIAVQLVLGAIPVSVSLALAPAAIIWLGLRGISAVPARWSVLALGGLVLSLAADLALLADSADLGPYQAQLALTAAGLVVLGAFLAVYLNYSAVDPDHVVETLTSRLDQRWLERVRSRGQFGRGAFGPDPFESVERVLTIAAVRDRDRALFDTSLDLIEGRFRVLLFPTEVNRNHPDRIVGPDIDTEEAFDLYLADNLRALVGEVFATQIEWAPTELLWIRESLEPRPQPSVGQRNYLRFGNIVGPARLVRSFRAELPPGLTFYGLVIGLAIRSGADRDAAEGIESFNRYLQRCLLDLPATNTVTLFGPQQAQAHSGAGDEFIWALQECFRRIDIWMSECVERKLERAMRQMARGYSRLIEMAARLDNQDWANFLVARFGAEASDLARIAAPAGIRAFQMPMLQQRDARDPLIPCAVLETAAQQVELAMVMTPGILETVHPLEVGWVANAMLPNCAAGAGRLVATHVFLLRRHGPDAVRQDAERSLQQRLLQLGGARAEFQQGFDDQMRRLESIPAPANQGRESWLGRTLRALLRI